MTTDLLWAIGHHIAVFAMVAVLGGECALLRPGLDIPRVAKLDAGYGALAGLVILIGIGRVMFGLKGGAYYLHNPWFWGKMGAFALIGALSVVPTIAILKWRRQVRDLPSFAPESAAVARLRRYAMAELHLVIVVVACAAAMARMG